jgi:hypothetical protein
VAICSPCFEIFLANIPENYFLQSHLLHAVPELVKQMGEPQSAREGMRYQTSDEKAQCDIRGEHSAFYFRQLVCRFRVDCIPCLPELISVENKPLHELVSEIDPYVRSGEINSKVHSIPETLESIRRPDNHRIQLMALPLSAVTTGSMCDHRTPNHCCG